MASKNGDSSKGKGAVNIVRYEGEVLVNAKAITDIKDVLASIFTTGASIWNLSKVSVPGAGGTMWEVPDIEADEGIVNVAEIECILLDMRSAKAYYDSAYDGAGGPPTCSSTDCITGHGDPGGKCADCPFNQFGSAKNDKGEDTRGKACSDRKHVMILTADSMIPNLLDLPPTSGGAIQDYILRVAGKGLHYSAVLTGLKLVKAQTASSPMFSKVAPRLIGRLDPEQAQLAREYGKVLEELFSGLPAQPVAPNAPAEDE